MFVSGLYGLRLESPWPLGPPPPAGRAWPSLRVVETRAPLAGPLPPDGRGWFHYRRLDDGSDHVRWSGLAEFLVAPGGRLVRCRLLHRRARAAMRTYLLGHVVSFALLKRGIEPLHATAVVVDGQAVAFLGECGAGKSTLAAAFIAAGARLLTDDLLVVRRRRGGEMACAGPGRIKLYPRVARALLGSTAGAAPMHRGTRKLVLPLGGPRITRAPERALRAVYVLGARARPRRPVIRRLSPRRAFLALVRNTFNPVVTDPARQARLLAEAGRLAVSVPVRSLAFPRRLSGLPDVLDAIRRDLAA